MKKHIAIAFLLFVSINANSQTNNGLHKLQRFTISINFLWLRIQ